ncbi:SDR family oxidoreductase [Massilia oculi]|uniref:SDR family oxidoreductase n=1 Tax=Massilia hydrophila TaxID=3044279 RepID=A0ABS7YDV8_9BURK|nr:SDR family oxidoreductase [Massilia oculi]MCA1857894.1 SDR family oxidoreductase [Massilia oculi]
MRFSNQVVIVTGAAGGIGLATARRFGAEGASVALVDQDAKALAAAAAQVRGDTLQVVCDVGDEGQVSAAVDRVMQRYRRLDVVVNNAGLMMFRPIEELDGAQWNKILRVDLLGAFYFVKQGFLHMRPGGAIVNVASVHALETEPNVAPYAAAKAALLSLTRSAAIEGIPKGIRVNAILPGAVDTPMLWNNPQVKSGTEHLGPSEVGKPAQVAAAIAFLASSDAAFIQGASLLVDGGRLCQL